MKKGVLILVAVLLLLPAAGWSQSPSVAEAARQARRQRKTTPRKILTNEDISSSRKSGRKILPVATQEEEGGKPPSELAVELTEARKQLLSEQETLAQNRAALQASKADLRNANNDYDRQTLTEAIEFHENAIRESEKNMKALRERVVSLEKQAEADKDPEPAGKPAAGLAPPPR